MRAVATAVVLESIAVNTAAIGLQNAVDLVVENLRLARIAADVDTVRLSTAHVIVGDGDAVRTAAGVDDVHARRFRRLRKPDERVSVDEYVGVRVRVAGDRHTIGRHGVVLESDVAVIPLSCDLN